jgi:hypothetical protein
MHSCIALDKFETVSAVAIIVDSPSDLHVHSIARRNPHFVMPGL